MKMINILGGVASSAVIVAMAVVYLTADEAKAADELKQIVYVDRVVERVVHVPVPQRPNTDPEAIFADASERDRHCLAQNIYFEGRGESAVGQEFIAWVTLNRVISSDFPNDICSVVWQNSQFSWTHDGKGDIPQDKAAWAKAQVLADTVIETYGVDGDPTEGSTYFHADYVNPVWTKSFDRVVQIDNHIFYADNG